MVLGEAPALDGQRDMPLVLRLSEGLGINRLFGLSRASEYQINLPSVTLR